MIDQLERKWRIENFNKKWILQTLDWRIREFFKLKDDRSAWMEMKSTTSRGSGYFKLDIEKSESSNWMMIDQLEWKWRIENFKEKSILQTLDWRIREFKLKDDWSDWMEMKNINFKMKWILQTLDWWIKTVVKESKSKSNPPSCCTGEDMKNRFDGTKPKLQCADEATDFKVEVWWLGRSKLWSEF